MNGLSKAIGGFLGFLLAGPGGCLLGILIGHIFDRNLIKSQTTHHHYAQYDTATQGAFLETTFLIMGYLAKLDGRVSEATIQQAQMVMKKLELNDQQRRQAMQWFNEGKQSHFSLRATLQKLITIGQYHQSLLQRFLDIQTQVAFADNLRLSYKKQQVLEEIYRILGFSLLQFNWFDPFMDATAQSRIFYEEYTQYYHSQGNTQTQYHAPSELKAAYQLLGISPQTPHVEVKKAYRRLMSQYHPDKLASQGLSKAQLAKANEKTQRIKAAYDKICKAKGFV
jgi:DnaJ like chaperone protein